MGSAEKSVLARVDGVERFLGVVQKTAEKLEGSVERTEKEAISHECHAYTYHSRIFPKMPIPPFLVPAFPTSLRVSYCYTCGVSSQAMNHGSSLPGLLSSSMQTTAKSVRTLHQELQATMDHLSARQQEMEASLLRQIGTMVGRKVAGAEQTILSRVDGVERFLGVAQATAQKLEASMQDIGSQAIRMCVYIYIYMYMYI